MNSNFFRLLVAAPMLLIAPALHAVTFDFNSNNASFTTSSGVTGGTAATDWTYGASAVSGAGNAWSVAGSQPGGGFSAFAAIISPNLTISTTGSVQLTFDHRFSFEVDGNGNYDGGQVMISLNGGAFTTVSAFTQNGYTGSVTANGNSYMATQAAFIGVSSGYGTPAYITSIASLGTFTAGDTLRVQFFGAWDQNTLGTPAGTTPNWVVDNVTVSNTAVPEPQTYAGIAGLAMLGWATYRRRLSHGSKFAAPAL